MNETSTLIQGVDAQRRSQDDKRLLLLNMLVLVAVLAVLGLAVATIVQTQPQRLASMSAASCFRVLFNGRAQPAFYVNRCNLPIIGVMKVDDRVLESDWLVPYSIVGTNNLIDANNVSAVGAYVVIYQESGGSAAATRSIEEDLSSCVLIIPGMPPYVINTCTIPQSALGIAVTLSSSFSGKIVLSNRTMGWINSVGSTCGYGAFLGAPIGSQVVLAVPFSSCA